MDELGVFLRESELSKITVVLFYPKNYQCTGFNFIARKDFKPESPDIPYPGYFIELKDKKILNLKQFKIEII
jgi:hypothetical protein